MNKKDKNKTILTIISTSIARKPNLKLPIPPLQAQLISTFPTATERNLSGRRTQSDWIPNATRSDTERETTTFHQLSQREWCTIGGLL